MTITEELNAAWEASGKSYGFTDEDFAKLREKFYKENPEAQQFRETYDAFKHLGWFDEKKKKRRKK